MCQYVDTSRRWIKNGAGTVCLVTSLGSSDQMCQTFFGKLALKKTKKKNSDW